MRIRSDLDGVVYAHLGDGVVRLAAGDPVPDGAVVGDHLIDSGTATAGEGDDDAGAGNHRRRVRSTRARTDD